MSMYLGLSVINANNSDFRYPQSKENRQDRNEMFGYCTDIL